MSNLLNNSVMNEKVNDKWQAMCDAIHEFKTIVRTEMAALDKELPLDNGYCEEGEPLVVNVVDDNCCGVITYELDKARVNANNGDVEFHACGINYDKADQWIGGYMLGSDETYAMENIIFPTEC